MPVLSTSDPLRRDEWVTARNAIEIGTRDGAAVLGRDDIPAERAQLLADYGLGAVSFNPDLFDGASVIGHSGGALFYSAVSLYLPDYGVTIGAAQNFDSDDAFGSIITQVVDLITTHLQPIP